MKRLLCFFAVFQIAHGSCPDGFDLVVNGECWGYYGTMSLSGSGGINTAVGKCKELQGQPVIIHNEQQQTYWTKQNRTGGSTFIFLASFRPFSREGDNCIIVPMVLGLTCNTSTKKWMWTDGSSVNYKPIGLYYPGLDGDCTTAWIWFQDSTGYWQATSSASCNIYCTIQMVQPVPSADGCDTFEDDSEDGACYQIGKTAEDYQEAQMICRSFGADLASIHNQKENSFIRRLAVSKGALGGLYLGATMTGKGSDFGWTDGSAWDYENFFQGFPMAGLGDCLVMDTQGTTGEWVNVDCSSKLSVACMRQTNYTLETCTSGPWKEGQIIYTPGFPYDASTPCDYIIEVEPNKRLQLQVHLLEANSCCDHLVIGDNYFGGNVLANLTGYVTDRTYTTSSSNFMRVSWQPNGGVNVRGAMFAFRGV